VIPYHFFMIITNIWARTLYRLRVYGKEFVPRRGPCIIVANHYGKLWADLMILPALWPRRRPISVTYAMPQRTSKSKQIPRVMSWGAKVFPIIVSGPRGKGTALKASRQIMRALKDGEAVFMMLTGEVSWHGRLGEPRPAVPWIALRSGVPLLPCGIIGTYDVWPRWREKPSLTGKVTVRFGRPFTLKDSPIKKITDEMVDDAGQRIQNEIEHLLAMGR
jgi:1-acyl-sn-glycerol-3-phosphate acyltransferase